MDNLVKDFLSQKSFAIAGSFRNELKYAYRIFKTLKAKGYQVYPVNPGMSVVEGVKCYPSIKDIPASIDVMSIVTAPGVTANIVRDCKELNINRVWMQPGAESKEVIEFCKNNDIKAIHGLCVMLEAR